MARREGRRAVYEVDAAGTPRGPVVGLSDTPVQKADTPSTPGPWGPMARRMLRSVRECGA